MTDTVDSPTERLAPDARVPFLPAGLRIEKPFKFVGGAAVLAESVAMLRRETGVRRGAKALTALDGLGERAFGSVEAADTPEVRGRRDAWGHDAKRAILEATRRRIDHSLFHQYSLDVLRGWSDLRLEQSGRLTTPLFADEGDTHLRPISWSRAFRVIAEEMKGLSAPDEAVFYQDGRLSNEAAFLWQLFARRFGSNNLASRADLSDGPRHCALQRVFGRSDFIASDEDLDHADCILLIGTNLGPNHPRFMRYVAQAKRRGAKVIAVNPLREAGLVGFKNPSVVGGFQGKPQAIADHFLQVRVNGDLALLKGLMKAQLSEEDRNPGRVLDHWFIESRSTGFRDFRNDLENTSWQDIEAATGLRRAEIESAGRIIAQSKGCIAAFGAGLSHQRDGAVNIEALAHLMLMRGMPVRRGSGLLPLGRPDNHAGSERVGFSREVSSEFAAAIAEEFKVSADVAKKPALDTLGALMSLHAGDARVLFCLGGNLLSDAPDTDFVAEALTRADLTVHTATRLHRGLLVPGRRSLVLPTFVWAEGNGTLDRRSGLSIETETGNVRALRGVVTPASAELRSDVAIVAAIAESVVGTNEELNWDQLAKNPSTLRQRMSKVIPAYEDLDGRLKDPAGFQVASDPATHGAFATADGRAQFCAHPLPDHQAAPLHFRLTTISAADQCGTTVFSLNDRTRGIFNERRVVFLNEEEMRELGFRKGEAVDITSHLDDARRTVHRFFCVPYDIPRGCAAVFYPEGNPLFSINHRVRGTVSPAIKSIDVTLSSSPWRQS